MSKYRFKVLDSATIVTQLSNIEIKINATELEDPQPAVVSLSYQLIGRVVNDLLGTRCL